MSDEDNRLTPRDHNLNELFNMVRDLSVEFATLKTGFMAHMQAEEGHYGRLESEIRGLREEVVRVANTVEGLEALQKAFPENDDGIPDLAGHYDDHNIRKADAKVWRNRWNRTKENMFDKVVTGVSIAFGVVLLLGAQSWLKGWLL